ncbi:MAG: GDP-mannose 4,6-dehydratase, partial [Caldilineaceae bacterium]|nr:GDP-mannose 4,6-dehydratase [Caldilineaceae bacterium]
IGHPNFRFVVDNISNPVIIDRLISECDTVYHLAASVGVRLIIENPVQTVENNIAGTECVLKAAVRYRTKVFIASTSEVYGKGQRVPFAEEDDVVLGPTSRNRWSYAASKMVDEFMGLAYHQQKNLPVVIFRLFNTVGPRQTGRYGMVIPRFVQQALQGEPLSVYGDGGQSRCFLHVQDAVAAIMALSKCPEAPGEVFNIGATDEVTILELAQRVLHTVDQRIAQGRLPTHLASNGHDRNGHSNGRFIDSHLNRTGQSLHDRIVMVPYSDAYTAGFEDMRRRVPSIAKIRIYTGWQPRRNLQQILDDVVDSILMQQQVEQELATKEKEQKVLQQKLREAVTA